MDIINMIQAFGFPIAACAVMAWYVKYITDQGNSRMDKMQSDHRTELQQITLALNNNTLALQHLTDLLAFEAGGNNG